MTTTVQGLAIKSVEEIRDDYLRSYRNKMIQNGIPNPIVGEGTEIYNRATSLAQQIYTASTAVPDVAAAMMPDTAQGDDLLRLAAARGLSLQPAGPSAGALVLSATVTTSIGIPQGAQLLDASGLTYQVAIGGQYTSGSNVPIESVSVGAATNLDQGAVLRWLAPPQYVNTTAPVAAGGLTGGVDAEGLEGLRGRLLALINSPPNGFNAAAVNGYAVASSSAVQASYAYPAANGPSTMHFAVVRAPTATNKGRDVASTVLDQNVRPGVWAQAPEFVEVTGTTVINYPVDVSFGINIPSSTTAVPAGPGGGWLDGVPFPVPDFSSFWFCTATTVTSSTQFTVYSNSAPTVGSQVCWLSADDWVLRTATITAAAGPIFSIWSITIDTPFVSSTANPHTIAVGDYVFPAATNMASYVAAAFNAFGNLGPGEKLASSSSLMPRASRRPLASYQNPSRLDRRALKFLTSAGAEVTDAAFLNLGITVGSPSAFSAQSYIAPPLNSSINIAPYIITPRHLAFYPLS